MMIRRRARFLLACCLLLGGAATSARADAERFTGTWTVAVQTAQNDITLWLVKLSKDGADLKGDVLNAGTAFTRSAKLVGVRVRDRQLELAFDFDGTRGTVTVYAPKEAKTPERLLGSVVLRGTRDMIRMERSKEEQLDQAKAVQPSAVSDLAKQIMKTTDGAERLKLAREALAKQPLAAGSYQLGMMALPALISAKANAKEVQDYLEPLLKIAAAHGREMQLTAVVSIGKQLAKTEHTALLTAQTQAAEKLLDAQDDQATRLGVLKLSLASLRKAGKKDEAARVADELEKIERKLDEEFEQTAIPFKPAKYDGQRPANARPVVVELFTGAQCPPCVAADVAFDALLKTYTSKDAVLLQYHLHIPGPDALTSPDSITRGKYYKARGTPTLVVNGGENVSVGGFKPHAQDRYEKIQAVIKKELDEAASGTIALTAKRTGEKIDIVADLAKFGTTNDKIRLRFVLVEEVVRYLGSNGQRLHHNVVRALPGGAEGAIVKAKDARYEQTVDLKELAKTLNRHLDETAQMRPFRDDARPMDFRRLSVVALVQDDETQIIMNARQVAVE